LLEEVGVLFLVLGMQRGEVAFSCSLWRSEELRLAGLSLGCGGVLEGNQFAGVEEVLLGVADGAEGLRVVGCAFVVAPFEL
jgi:hypothetical protein